MLKKTSLFLIFIAASIIFIFFKYQNKIFLNGLDTTNLQFIFNSYVDLSDDEKRILENTTYPADLNLKGEALYQFLAEPHQLQKNQWLADFLNQTVQLSKVIIDFEGQKRTVLSFIKNVYVFQQDRIFVNADTHLMIILSKDSRFTSARGHVGHPLSWKYNLFLNAGLQLSFSQDGSSIDIDTDYKNIKYQTSDIALNLRAAFVHWSEVAYNYLTHNQTDPAAVFLLLRQRGVYPNYQVIKKN